MKQFLNAILCLALLTSTLSNVTLALAANSSSASINVFTDNAPSENSEDDFLPPDKAFKLNITAVDANTLQAKFTIVPTYYLYRDRIKFTSKNAVISEIKLPKGEIKDDPNFGKMEVYHHDFIATIVLNKTNGQSATIEAGFQGCSEKGLCYAPTHNTVNVALTQGASSIADSNDDQATSLLKGGKLWLIVAGFLDLAYCSRLHLAYYR